MAITVAAVVPHPPLLVPELGRGSSPELDDLRFACRRAVAATLEGSEALLMIGGGPSFALASPGASASFAPYGADVRVALHEATGGWLDPDRLPPLLPDPLTPPDSTGTLPLSLAVAAWLLVERGGPGPARGPVAVSVPASLEAKQAAALGRALAQAADPDLQVGLLAMGDLSARRTSKAPATFHPGAAAFDQQVAAAVRDGQPSRLLDLDPALADELRVGGRVPLQVLAGALDPAGALRGEVLYDDAPYGVGYVVGILTVQ